MLNLINIPNIIDAMDIPDEIKLRLHVRNYNALAISRPIMPLPTLNEDIVKKL